MPATLEGDGCQLVVVILMDKTNDKNMKARLLEYEVARYEIPVTAWRCKAQGGGRIGKEGLSYRAVGWSHQKCI